MSDPAKDKELTVISVACIVAGWVFVSNLPRYSRGGALGSPRATGVEWANWEPWIGIILLCAGISYFILNPPWRRP